MSARYLEHGDNRYRPNEPHVWQRIVAMSRPWTSKFSSAKTVCPICNGALLEGQRLMNVRWCDRRNPSSGQIVMIHVACFDRLPAAKPVRHD